MDSTLRKTGILTRSSSSQGHWELDKDEPVILDHVGDVLLAVSAKARLSPSGHAATS